MCKKFNASDVKDLKISIIGRLPSDSFYTDQGRVSGADRRTISNIDELKKKLSIKFTEVNIFYLEGMLLHDKVNLLSSSHIIILQHGAALTSVYFLNENSTIIEILPKNLINPNLGIYDFSPAGLIASELSGNVYIQYISDGDHCELNINIIENMCVSVAENIQRQ